MIIIMMMILIITLIALKSAIRFFYSLLTAPQTVSSTFAQWPERHRVQITCNTSGADHVQHVVCHVVRRDSSANNFDIIKI